MFRLGPTSLRGTRLATAALRILLPWLLVLGLPSVAGALPSYHEVKSSHRPSDVLLLDRHGEPIGRVRMDFQVRRGEWVPLNKISVALQRAVILSEDKRFYSHGGVDWHAIAGAAWGMAVHGGQRGASTLSMQLVGLIDERLRRGQGGRSVMQKIDQVLEARSLEEHWTKAQILEAYLNLAAFHGEIVGVDALSRVIFQKHASALDARESALAAALLRGPNASRPVLVQRACHLLTALGVPQECGGLNDFAYLALLRKAGNWADSISLAPHFARAAFAQAQPADMPMPVSLRSSLDARLQRVVLQSVHRQLLSLGMANVRDAAVVVQDNRSGQILAYVGSSGMLSAASSVDHARALRQAGSTLKPFLYALAIEEQRLTAASLLDDGPLDLPTGNGLYIPQNYDKRFSGWVSVRTALASSLNIPAVRALLMVSPEAFARRLVQLGLPLDQSGDFYGYSLALGSADVTLLSLTNAYRSLANTGKFSAAQYSPDTPTLAESAPTMSQGAAWIVADILSDRQARARTFGLDSPLSTPFWTAVKTGTSKDMRDNWCVGWSQHYTVGVWVGNSGGGSMHDVTGVSGAGPIWHEIMAYLHRHLDSIEPPRPAEVNRGAIVFDEQIEPARYEVFLGDTRVERVRLARTVVGTQPTALRIRAPSNGTILALDPDIPADSQRVLLSVGDNFGARDANLAWRVDGELVGKGRNQMWTPVPGRHQIELIGPNARTLDLIHIEVRGARLRQGVLRTSTN